MRFSKRWVVAALTALLASGAGAASGSQASGPDEARLFLHNGDLVTATGKTDTLVRLRLRPNKTRSTKVNLGIRLKPKGITYSKNCEKIAIANSSNVVIYDVWTRQVEVVEDARFGLIADVQYDMQCNLIIADMGHHSVGRWPRDGHLWKRDVKGEIWEIGLRANFVNPAFLDMDEWGVLYVLDKEAGPRMPRAGQWYFDAIYKMGAPDYQFAKAKYRRAGLTATSFMVHPDGRMFVGNGDSLVVIENGKATDLCGPVFTRVNGIALDEDLNVYINDGYDIYGKTTVQQLGPGCSLQRVITGSMLDGAQGLAVGLPAR